MQQRVNFCLIIGIIRVLLMFSCSSPNLPEKDGPLSLGPQANVEVGVDLYCNGLGVVGLELASDPIPSGAIVGIEVWVAEELIGEDEFLVQVQLGDPGLCSQEDLRVEVGERYQDRVKVRISCPPIPIEDALGNFLNFDFKDCLDLILSGCDESLDLIGGGGIVIMDDLII